MDYTKIRNCKLFLLDMDGTLYLGDEVFKGAIEYINTLSETGRKYIYLTNNSSRAGVDYVGRLNRLGFPCEMENVFTSGMATGLYLNEKYKGKKIYPVGTRAFLRELESYGVEFSETDADVVVVTRNWIKRFISCAADATLLQPTRTGYAQCLRMRFYRTVAVSVRC